MSERAICVLISALGGQGGGVLTNWLVEAARLAGFPAQATSIPGVAQRTGATTYYFELFPNQNPPADPVFCLFPSTGEVDLLAALEPTEAGRALDRGYVSDRTTVITSTVRVYSTAEKSIAGNGIVPTAPILETLSEAAQALIQIDPDAPANSQLNALFFGAIIGSDVLPLSVEDGRRAIESRGLAVTSNTAGFEAGLKLAAVHDDANTQLPAITEQLDPPPPGLEEAIAPFPATLRPLLGHALARLNDYQNESYAQLYLERLQPVLAADQAASGWRLTTEVARRLAMWMSYEDAMRVAQLKTRPGRLERIRAEIGAQAGEPVKVRDYLSPGREEFVSVLPAFLSRLVPGANHKNGTLGRSLHLTWPTSSPWGYGVLKLLAGMRWIRPHTQAYAREQGLIEMWLTAVNQSVAVDYELACQVAELAVWARGYGAVRARGLACLKKMFTGWSQRLQADVTAVRADVAASLSTARNDPDSLCTPQNI